jgi:hypothetical protein
VNVNSLMSTYNLNSLWNSLNPSSTSTTSVPLIDNVDSSINQEYNSMEFSGQTASTELQNIYQQVEPDYGISMTYKQDGSMSLPTTTTLSSDGSSEYNSGTISLLNSGNSSSENTLNNIMSEYTSIEDGTYQPNLSSILSNDPSTLYSTIDSLGNSNTQSSSSIDATA